MKKQRWISGLLATMVLLSCLAIPSATLAETPSVDEWIPVGRFLIGIGLGVGLYVVYDTVTGAVWTCTCDETQGDANWSANCPEGWTNQFGNRCPEY